MKNLKRFAKAVFGLGMTKGQATAQTVGAKTRSLVEAADERLGVWASDLETKSIAKKANIEKPNLEAPEVKAGQRTDERDDG